MTWLSLGTFKDLCVQLENLSHRLKLNFTPHIKTHKSIPCMRASHHGWASCKDLMSPPCLSCWGLQGLVCSLREDPLDKENQSRVWRSNSLISQQYQDYFHYPGPVQPVMGAVSFVYVQFAMCLSFLYFNIRGRPIRSAHWEPHQAVIWLVTTFRQSELHQADELLIIIIIMMLVIPRMRLMENMG